MLVKLAAICIFLVMNRKLLREKSIFRQRYIWFYGIMTGIGLVNALLSVSSLTTNYLVVLATGSAFWLLCILAAAVSNWYVRKTDAEKLHATLTLFFILNMAVTFFQLLLIIMDSGSLNPYRYQGQFQKYFINTGDRITGIAFDVSTTNALISGFGLLYFLSRERMALVLLSMTAFLLTTSNFANILLLVVLMALFVFRTNRYQKSVIVICWMMLIFFLARVTPQNDRYVREFIGKFTSQKDSVRKKQEKELPLTERPDSTLSPDELRKKTARLYLDSLYLVMRENEPAVNDRQAGEFPDGKPTIPHPSIHSAPYQRRRDTTEYQKELFAYGKAKDSSFQRTVSLLSGKKLPGKIAAFQQTLRYLKQHPVKILTGTGTGNFSSKLAFRATGLRVAGGYPARFIYTHPDFVTNHLGLFLAYFSRDRELHSLVNTPNSVYDQLLAEYGLAGLAAFVIFYLGFFRKATGRKGYGTPLLLFLLGALAAEYWFEQLSVIILFELMMLIHLKEKANEG